jgi:hypothetical protein
VTTGTGATSGNSITHPLVLAGVFSLAQGSHPDPSMANHNSRVSFPGT